MRTFRAPGPGALWLALVVLAVPPACRGHQPASRPDVLVVVVDTLRADRLGAYGNRDGLTPFLDSLAARGTVFRRAYAQTSWTNPSVASLLTSRYQSQHGVITFASVLAESETTLSEVLRTAGYATGGFSANGLINAPLGFAQGYDRYRAHLVKNVGPQYRWLSERAVTITTEARGWLDTLWSQGRPAMPVFLYLHYMEVHTPYAPPPELLARVRDGRPPPDLDDVNRTVFLGHLGKVPPEKVADIVDAYDAMVLAMDDALRALFAQLEQRGFLDHALVVITSDHGEEFKEHGLMGHEKTLFEEVIHVPLIVLTPGQREPVVVEEVVSLVDVAPTVLEVIGVPVPATFEGVSRAAALGHGGLVARLRYRLALGDAPGAYTELIKPQGARRFTPHERAVVLTDRKLILGVGGEREFYRLDVDPGERNPDGVPAGERDALAARLEAVRAKAGGAATRRETKPIDAETRERMRALGYTD
jgi:arylsulfatase A-like enzyme